MNSKASTNNSKKLIFITTSFFALLFFVELFSTIAVKLFTDQSLYEYRSHYKQYVLDEGNPSKRPVDAFNFDLEVPHPYFAYVQSKETPKRFGVQYFNNFGFSSPDDYPYAKKKDEFTIGIFGGSVAYFFAINNLDNKYFQKKLKAKFPKLKNKTIKILNMALGASKQPQQFHIYSFFADMFDFVINIEGENEINLYPDDSYPLEYPFYANHLFGDESKVKNSNMRILVYKEILSRLSCSFSKYFFLRTSTAYLGWRSIRNVIEGRIVTFQKIAREEIAQDRPRFYKAISRDERREKLFSIWRKYSTFQATLLNKNKTPYMFFVQPTQYLPGSKPMSKEEKKIAFSDEDIEWKYETYKKSEDLTREMQKEGIQHRSLLRIYKDTKEQIFVDNCCHVNGKGNIIMADAILKNLESHPYFQK